MDKKTARGISLAILAAALYAINAPFLLMCDKEVIEV